MNRNDSDSNSSNDDGSRGYHSPVVGRPLMREAAFQLLASSDIRRYMREARRLTAESGLPGELGASAELRTQAQARLAHLLERIDRESLRTPEEFEAVILLCALVPLDPDGTRKQLRRACKSSSRWVRSAGTHLSSPTGTRAEGPCASGSAGALAHAA